MRFLCDHMLSRLGKWLRAAGYDTDIITSPISDHEVLSIALATDRLLVTRDRHFLAMQRAISKLLYLKNNNFEACIKELNQNIKINWLYAPFSRCLICNSLLEKPRLSELKQISLEIRQKKHEFWYCSSCRHIYWEGSHTAHMRHQLQIWQKESDLLHN
jgi:uncharacterized protein with PIN domain